LDGLQVSDVVGLYIGEGFDAGDASRAGYRPMGAVGRSNTRTPLRRRYSWSKPSWADFRVLNATERFGAGARGCVMRAVSDRALSSSQTSLKIEAEGMGIGM